MSKNYKHPLLFYHFDDFAIDLNLLQQDYANLISKYSKIWNSHPGYQKQWYGFSIKNATGSTSSTDMTILSNYDLVKQIFKPSTYTEYIEHIPYIKSLLNEIENNLRCQTHLVRILKIEPKTILRVHNDGPCFDPEKKSMYRLHIPIHSQQSIKFRIFPTSNPKIYEEHHLQEGHLYYVNVSEKHCVINVTDTTRIHLVIDCSYSPELEKQIMTYLKL